VCGGVGGWGGWTVAKEMTSVNVLKLRMFVDANERTVSKQILIS
jgi:hypothetical protein